MSSQIPSGSSPTAKRRAGVPVWRVGKPDTLLAAAVETARAALVDEVESDHVGQHLGAKSEGERLVTHLFECLRPGYRGWTWYVTVTRISRSKIVTVSELGLLPGENAVLAPEWVPWSERVRPEDSDDASSGEETEVAESEDEAEVELEADDADEAVDLEAEEAGVTDIDDEID
jgi:hypothetical protein